MGIVGVCAEFDIAHCNNGSNEDREEIVENARLIAAAPDMLEALTIGDYLGNSGPGLLMYAADFIESIAGTTATVNELRRKAGIEFKAISKATGKEPS